MARAIKVLLSSTFLNLKEHRKSAIMAMLEHIWVDPLGMELRAPTDEKVLDGSLAMVRDCHIYLGLLGSRYGTTSADDFGNRVSNTEMELKEAARLHLYKILLISDQLADAKINSPDLERLRTFFNQHCNGRFNENDPDSLWRPVSSSLTQLKHLVNGHILIKVNRPYSDFVTGFGADQISGLRQCIAKDAGDVPSEQIWLILFGAPDKTSCWFRCFLPKTYKFLYLKRESWNCGVVKAIDVDEDDPTGAFNEAMR
jgi:hypothetical protein